MTAVCVIAPLWTRHRRGHLRFVIGKNSKAIVGVRHLQSGGRFSKSWFSSWKCSSRSGRCRADGWGGMCGS